MTKIPTHYHTTRINYLLSAPVHTTRIELDSKKEQRSLRNLSIHDFKLFSLLLSTFTFIMLLRILTGFLGLWISCNKWGQDDSCNEDLKRKKKYSKQLQ